MPVLDVVRDVFAGLCALSVVVGRMFAFVDFAQGIEIQQGSQRFVCDLWTTDEPGTPRSSTVYMAASNGCCSCSARWPA